MGYIAFVIRSQYEMQFLPQKATKGQAVADFLAEHSNSRAIRLYEDLPDEIAKAYMTQTSFKEQVWQYSSTAHQGCVPQGTLYLEWG